MTSPISSAGVLCERLCQRAVDAKAHGLADHDRERTRRLAANGGEQCLFIGLRQAVVEQHDVGCAVRRTLERCRVVAGRAISEIITGNDAPATPRQMKPDPPPPPRRSSLSRERIRPSFDRRQCARPPAARRPRTSATAAAGQEASRLPRTNKEEFVMWSPTNTTRKFPRPQRVLKSHRLATRRRDQFALPHDLAAAHERADRPAGHGDAVIRRPAGARGDPAVGDGLAALEIDHREVGVIARRDPALAGDAVNPRRPGAGQIDEAGSDSRPALT